MIFKLLFCIAIGLHGGLVVFAAGPVKEPKCGSELPDNEGSFQSPAYPIIYPDNLNCTWTIKRPQKASVLKFRDFEYTIKQHWTWIKKTTTTRKEENITRTPYPCVHDLQVESGEIKSPEYPHDYPNDLGCSWTIKRPSKPGVLKFEDFDVESANWGERCQFDYLYVFVGTGRSVTSYGPYCGTEKPENIVYNDTVQVTSTTDGDGTHRGFKLTFGPSELHIINRT